MNSNLIPLKSWWRTSARGKMVIITDDEHRENEGDIVIAAAHATPEAITFMATHACGLICAPLTAERAAELNLSTPASLTDPFGHRLHPERRRPEGNHQRESAPSTGPEPCRR